MSYHCFSEKLVTAKKPHSCIWCCLPTLVGSLYVREHSVYDGSFQNFAWHEACRADAIAWFEETREEEFCSGVETDASRQLVRSVLGSLVKKKRATVEMTDDGPLYSAIPGVAS